MPLRPPPEKTYALPGPRRRGRRPDPWRYLKRLGDADRAQKRLMELQERAALSAVAEREWAALPRVKRLCLTIIGIDAVAHYMARAERRVFR